METFSTGVITEKRNQVFALVVKDLGLPYVCHTCCTRIPCNACVIGEVWSKNVLIQDGRITNYKADEWQASQMMNAVK